MRGYLCRLHALQAVRAVNLWTWRVPASICCFRALLVEHLAVNSVHSSPAPTPEHSVSQTPSSCSQTCSHQQQGYNHDLFMHGRSLAQQQYLLATSAPAHLGLRQLSSASEAAQAATHSHDKPVGSALAGNASIVPDHDLPPAQQPSHSSAGDVLPKTEQARQELRLRRMIEAIDNIPEAEWFLKAHAQQMRVKHVAQFLMQLPTLQTDVDNAHQRLRTLARLTSASLHYWIHQLKATQLIGCIWALAKLGTSPQGFTSRAVARLIQGHPPLLSVCRGPELSKLAWAVASLQVLYGKSLEEPESPSPASAIKLLGDRWRSEAMSGSSRHDPASRAGDTVWQPLVQAALIQVNTMSGHDVSQLAWALASVSVYHKPLFSILADRAIHLCPVPSSATTSLAFPSNDALAVMSFRQRRVLYKQRRAAERSEQEAAAASALTKAPSSSGGGNGGTGSAVVVATGQAQQAQQTKQQQVLSSREAADMVWAYTSARHRHPRLFAALANAIRHDQLSLEVEDIATVMWGYATWGFYDGLLLECLLPRVVKSLVITSPDHASRVVWSSAALQHQDMTLVKRLSKVLPNWQVQGTRLTTYHAVNMLWSLAVLPPPAPCPHYQSCVLHVLRHLSSTDAVQELTTSQLLRTFWATASVVLTIEPRHMRQVAQVVMAVLGALKHRSPSEVAPELLGPLHHASLVLGSTPTLPQLISNMVAHADGNADADAEFGNPPTQTLVTMHDATTDDSDGAVGSTQHDAVAVVDQDGILDISYVQPFKSFSSRPGLVATGLEPHQSLLAHLVPAWGRAVYHAALEAAVSACPESEPDQHESHEQGSVRRGLRRGGRQGARQRTASGQVQQDSNPLTGCVVLQPPRATWLLDVQQALRELGIMCDEGLTAVHGTSPVDLAVMTSTGKLAIVLAGRAQHTRSVPHALLGHSKMMQHLLRLDGWRVVVIPWYEWSLMHTDEEQYMYLLSQLEHENVVVK